MKRHFPLMMLAFVLAITPLLARTTPQSARAQDEMGEAISLPGLDGEVRVEVDGYGVPHIYATTAHDLFMVQGYMHAKDRWWQMEWFRHQGAGRLSELMGANLVGTDTFLRTFGLNRNAAQDLEALSPEALGYLEAYAAGVNAHIEGKEASELAQEYNFISLLGGDTNVEPWMPIHSLLLVQALTFDQESGDLGFELVKQGVTDAAGPLAAALLLPGYNYDGRPVISEPGRGYEDGGASLPEVDSTALAPLYDMEIAQLPQGFGLEGVGSNSWVVAGERTDTGLPYLANDPHIGIQMPPVWYMNGLHCVEVNADCPFNVYGYSFASVPFVVIGHNANIAWGWTNSGLDTMDNYILQLNPDNPLQYLYEGEYVDMEVVEETIVVGNGEAEPVVVPVRLTRFGPFINDAIGQPTPMAVRWTASEAIQSVDAIIALNLAANWDEFQAAGELFAIGQNWIYADMEGNIGIMSTGRIPLRAEGHDGSRPVDGSVAAFEWAGYSDPAENPRLFNPEVGYIVAANNAFARPENLPALMSTYFDMGYRAERIETLIQETEVMTIERMAEIQNDTWHPAAQFLVPALQALTLDDPALQEAVTMLGAWDQMNDVDSAEAAIFNAFYDRYLALTFDEILATGEVDGDSWQILITSQIIGNANHPLWGNAEFPDATRDDLLTMALSEGLATLTEELGEDMSTWTWGAVHQASFRHNPLGNLPSGVNPGLDVILNDIYRTFNRRTPVGGGTSSVNNQRWQGSTGSFLVAGAMVSMRQVIDLSNLDNSRFVITVGQSGDPFSPHYDDQLALWANGEYIPYGFTPEGVTAISAQTLTFTPGE